MTLPQVAATIGFDALVGIMERAGGLVRRRRRGGTLGFMRSPTRCRCGQNHAYEQQQFTGGLCERVGKAIAEIQLGRMSAAFTEIPVSVPGEPGLNFGDRFDKGRVPL